MRLLILVLAFLFLTACASSIKQSAPEENREAAKEEVRYSPIIVEDEYTEIEVPEEMSEVTMSAPSEEYQPEPVEEYLVPMSAEPMMDLTGPSVGTIAYNMDSVFYYEQVSRVKAKISVSDYVEVTSELIEAFEPTATGELVINTIKTSEVMAMVLEEVVPGTVRITSLSTADQKVEEGWTTWEWSILPLRKGTCYLRLRAVIKDESGNATDLVVFDKQIPIKVKDKLGWFSDQFHSTLGKFKDYWYFLTVIVIPAFLWFRKKNSRKSSSN